MKVYYVAYGYGDIGRYTIYGVGRTIDEAKRDSVQYGYDIEMDEPHLFVEEISDRAYKYILLVGSNNMEDEVFLWDREHEKLMMKEEMMRTRNEQTHFHYL